MITNVFKSLLFGFFWSVVILSVSVMAVYVSRQVVASDSWLLQVAAVVVLLVCMVVFGCYKYKLLKAEQEWGFDDDDDDEDVDVISVDTSRPNNIWLVVSVMEDNTDWSNVFACLTKADRLYTQVEGITDPVMSDLQSEELTMRRRLLGAIAIRLSDEYEKWGCGDQQLFRKQLYAMYIYHAMLWERVKRFHLVDFDDKEQR